MITEGTPIDDIVSGLESIAAKGLSDPKVSKHLQSAAAKVLRDPDTRAAMRPLLIEAGLWLGGAVLIAMMLGRRL